MEAAAERMIDMAREVAAGAGSRGHGAAAEGECGAAGV